MKLVIARRLPHDVGHERRRVSLTTMLREANKAWQGVRLHQPDWDDWSHSVALRTVTPKCAFLGEGVRIRHEPKSE